MKTFIFWLNTIKSPRNWLLMEQEECHPYSPATILLAPTKISRLLYNNNPIIHDMSCIWKQIKSSYNLKSISSALPIDRNPTFAPSSLGGSFLSGIKNLLNVLEICIYNVYLPCFLNYSWNLDWKIIISFNICKSGTIYVDIWRTFRPNQKH